MQASSDTQRVVKFYAEAWMHHDAAAVRRLIAPDAEIDWNLDVPVDDEQLVHTLDRLAARSTAITVTSENYTADSAALVYDCRAAFGTARFVELLMVNSGHIVDIRQIHDPAAIRRYFPDLLDDLG